MAKNLDEAAAFVMTCFHARTAAHVLHLTTHSYAAHKALNKFYDDIIPLADDIAEQMNGDNKMMLPAQYNAVRYTYRPDPVAFMEWFRDYVDEHRDDVSDESHIQNIIDEICSLIDSTLYKLRFLK